MTLQRAAGFPLFLLFCTLVALVFAGLGLWQLERANEKSRLHDMVMTRLGALPMTHLPAELSEQEHSFYPVALAGHYLQDKTIYLDNIVHDKISGYYVFTPFQLTNQRVILVNRGWIPAGTKRDQLPEISTPTSEITIKGQLNPPRSKPIMMGDLPKPDANHSIRWFYMDTDYFAQKNHLKTYSLIVRLSAEDQDGFVRDWPKYDAKINMHIGYAIQWFVFALFVLIGVIGLYLRQNKNNE